MRTKWGLAPQKSKIGEGLGCFSRKAWTIYLMEREWVHVSSNRTRYFRFSR